MVNVTAITLHRIQNDVGVLAIIFGGFAASKTDDEMARAVRVVCRGVYGYYSHYEYVDWSEIVATLRRSYEVNR